VTGISVRLTAWRFVATFGVVSLLADLVYEGARSVSGPYLASLGASAVVVGVVTGAGEAVALAGRLATGPLTDRTRAYWPITLIGYGVTLAAVPLLGVFPALGVVAALFLLERAGKAIRSPAKDVMLSHASAAVGRGRGFAVHEALDQVGALAGPLLVALLLAVTGGYRAGFLVLALPGIAAMVLLVWLRARVPEPSRYEPEPHPDAAPDSGRLSPLFWRYLAFVTVSTAGYATFGVLGYHLAVRDVLPVFTIPLVYAAAMAVDGLAALGAGWLYDRTGLRSLVAVPVFAALTPVLAFTTSPVVAVAGVLAWGVVLGIQESTMRAAVADLVPTARRGTGYGVFAAAYGAAALVGGALTGYLYGRSVPLLVAVVAVVQVVALILLVTVTRASRRPV
jgi:MFS family permease